jgi:RNA polymerase sigma factor (sigma-70 family)
LHRPEAWVTRVALNLAHSHFRRKRYKRRARECLEAGLVRVAEPADTAAAVALRDALAALPPRQRTALVLCYYADLPVAEIAELLDCPISTAKSHIRRGLARLRTHSESVNVNEENFASLSRGFRDSLKSAGLRSKNSTRRPHVLLIRK